MLKTNLTKIVMICLGISYVWMDELLLIVNGWGMSLTHAHLVPVKGKFNTK